MKPIHAIPVVLCLLTTACVHTHVGQITVRVTDESSAPVTNANVSAGFSTMISPGWGWGAGKSNDVDGTTNTNGVCTLRGKGNGGSVGVAVSKEGYYGSSDYMVFTNRVGIIRQKWQPWNPIINLMLRPIGHPIPMYAKSFGDRAIPVVGQPVGFDLIAGDWVAPHGKGTTSDFFLQYKVEAEETIETMYGPTKTADRKLTVTFLNEGDGVVSALAPTRGRCSLRLSPTAPENGFSSNIFKRVVKDLRGIHSDIREDQNYYLRVRTKKDEKGNIISALYGKIHGDFRFDEHRRVTFTYYLNPTPNDRNVEFDPEKNLFKRLPSLEQVRMP